MEQKCRETGKVFEITSEDLVFYQRVSPQYSGQTLTIPPPTLCPEARQRRHLTFRNERTLYRRACSSSGKPLVSIYSPQAPFPVFSSDIWFGDSWDGLSYGLAFDFSKTFFEQYAELSKVVPRPALLHRSGNENSPYTNLVSENRNCHYVFAASKNEDCYYSTYIQRCRDVADSFFIFDSELCYECIDCFSCYRLRYSQDCTSCSESDYLLGCTGCKDCFGCVSLTTARYCLFNQQLRRDEYFAAVAKLQARPDCADIVANTLAALCAKTPRKYYSGIDNQDCTGDHLAHCRNAQSCFDCTGIEDCKRCTWLHNAKDCYDCYAWGLPGELGLENHLVGNNFYQVIFSQDCSDNISHLCYCQTCHLGSSHLFGCIGLKKKQYCILNFQYSRSEYEALIPKIVEHMRETKEWGEYFPQALSPFGYNETVAQEYFPLTEQEVRKLGWNWRSEDLPGVYGTVDGTIAELNQPIEVIGFEICEKTFKCSDTGKNFRFTKPEITLYKKLQVPLPTRCFDARYSARFAKRNPRQLFSRNCSMCDIQLLSPYAKERPERICCEACYLDSTQN
jgi:hypothetical protein